MLSPFARGRIHEQLRRTRTAPRCGRRDDLRRTLIFRGRRARRASNAISSGYVHDVPVTFHPFLRSCQWGPDRQRPDCGCRRHCARASTNFREVDLVVVAPRHHDRDTCRLCRGGRRRRPSGGGEAFGGLNRPSHGVAGIELLVQHWSAVIRMLERAAELRDGTCPCSFRSVGPSCRRSSARRPCRPARRDVLPIQ